MEKKNKEQKLEDSKKGKVLYHLWLNEDEMKLVEMGEDGLPSVFWGVIMDAKKRGDFCKS